MLVDSWNVRAGMGFSVTINVSRLKPAGQIVQVAPCHHATADARAKTTVKVRPNDQSLGRGIGLLIESGRLRSARLTRAVAFVGERGKAKM